MPHTPRQSTTQEIVVLVSDLAHYDTLLEKWEDIIAECDNYILQN